MRWGKMKPRPKFGTTRIRSLYAWVPRKLSDGSWVWLEYYLQKEMYMNAYRTDESIGEWEIIGRQGVSPPGTDTDSQ